MLKDRGELERKLLKYISESSDKTQRQKWFLEIEQKYSIPIAMSSDIISARKDFSEYNTFVLFCITDVIKNNEIYNYFTKNEIKMFSNMKYTKEEITFPIELDMFKVTDDQYIGVSSVKFLMKLRAAQLINYNPDTQRALQIISKGKEEIYRPFLSLGAVKEIEESYNNNTFIPNTISLNISLDDKVANYNFNNNKLTINNIEAFDIFDGYHRYVAMGRNYDLNPGFDYPIELRITMFSVEKAKQFIWQEQHQTKMKKVDANTFDQYNIANKLINRLNTEPSCYLHDNINNKDGVVNSGYAYNILNILCKHRKFETKDMFQMIKQMTQNINLFIENNPAYLERKWSSYETYIILYGAFNNIDTQQIINKLNSMSPNEKRALDRMYTYNLKFLGMVKEVYDNE